MNMEIGDIHIDVERKAIRHIYLYMRPKGECMCRHRYGCSKVI